MGGWRTQLNMPRMQSLRTKRGTVRSTRGPRMVGIYELTGSSGMKVFLS